MSKATNPAKLATVCCPECGHGFDVDVNWLLRKVGAEAELRSRDEAVRELLKRVWIVCDWLGDDSATCHLAHAKLRAAAERLEAVMEGK